MGNYNSSYMFLNGSEILNLIHVLPCYEFLQLTRSLCWVQTQNVKSGQQSMNWCSFHTENTLPQSALFNHPSTLSRALHKHNF